MKKLSEQEIKNELKRLDGWEFTGKSIKKTFSVKNFALNMALVSGIGSICEQFDHHPDYMLVKYSTLEVAFSTHDANGITEKDFNNAREIEAFWDVFSKAE
jgi:4a-hydroxytetrahydrobiopterin dehydratase